MIITYANVFLFALMSKKSVITLFEKSLSSPKSIPFRVEAPIISPYKFLIMNLLYNVLFRECHRITSRRLYFGVCILLPLFCLFFMATIFGNGQMENIPIGIVDQDNTAASRTIARRIAATPTFRVTEHFTDEASARQALQRKEIYGYLSIPPQFEQKTVSGTGATLTYYYHYALLSVGSELMAAFETTLAPVALSPIVVQAEALGVGQEQIQTFLLPVEANTHPLYNPDMDYSIYLSQPFFFVLFQILILLVTVYTIGSEFKFGTTQEWMGAATPAGKDPANLRNADMLTAVAGKLLPYTVMFSVIGILANYVLFGLMNIPFQGSLWLMNIVTVLFIMATQALAVLIFSIFPKIAYIISVVSMVGSLGATLSGVTFPVTAMYAPVHAASYLFPVRHFTEAAQAMIYFGAGFAYFWQSVAVLLVFLLLAILILPLLKWWILRRKESEETLHIGDKALSGIAATDIQSGISSGTSPGTEASLSNVIRHEWKAIATNPAILLVLAGGIFLYGLLYNYMYAPNLVRKAPVAVVDLSHSALSREYVRWLDAAPQTSVYAQTPNILEARKWMKKGEVTGILYIPSDFETHVARGETSVFTLYAATDAFLNFKGLQEASSRVMLAVNDAHRRAGTVFLPPQGLLAVASSTPVSVSGTALYNYTEGYGSYLIPAVMIVIIFQTMLMVIAMLTGEEAEQRRKGIHSMRARFLKDMLCIVSGRTFVYVMLYVVFSMFLLGLLPHIFSIPNIGSGWDIVTMMIPFLFATCFVALGMSRWFTESEAPLLMIAFFSVGYIFLSGVSYPLELMPWYWQAAHYVFPVAPAVLAFVKLNSMGGSLADIWPQMLTLWIQVIIYGAWAVYTTRRVYKRSNIKTGDIEA